MLHGTRTAQWGRELSSVCSGGLLALVAGLGLLFAGCGPEQTEPKTFSTDGGTGEACTSNCKNEGTRVCSGDGKVLSCVRTDGGCLRMEPAVNCPAYKHCEGGECVDEASCSDRCTPDDDARCNRQDQLVECDDFDDDGCFEWGNPTDCGSGQTCDDESGSCVEIDCEDQCASGDTKCEGDLIRRCEQMSNGCLEYAAAESCPQDEVCSGGSCQASGSCRDECTEAICTTDGKLRRCEDVDGDGCTELAAAESCSGGATCENGGCGGSGCSDECPKGEKICVNGKIAECADHDSDPCVEFNNPQSCPSGETCVDDGSTVQCDTPQSSGGVVINEVFYDALGHDLRGSGSSATSPTFVEVAGAAGFDISGYEIELINGANGSTYGTFQFPSGAELDGTGYAVASMQRPNSYFTQTAPSLTNVYRILKPYRSGSDAVQNGPDNVVLKDDSGTTVDALGYGNFSSVSGNFEGEGSAAPGVVSGRSLGRMDGTDTDDNSADFRSYYPTPGLQNSDLLVNEVYPNQPGKDDKTQTFIEIAAPIPNWENFSLNGYVVHAVNGYDGKDYIPSSGGGVSLFGDKLHDGNTDDGYFVICNEAAPSPPQGPPCNVAYSGGDLQNGPDNVVLEYKGETVDAVGYGSFGSGDHFAGEGTEVGYSYSDAGKSLSRWPLPNQFFDFDDNSIDFWKTQPSPGTTNYSP